MFLIGQRDDIVHVFRHIDIYLSTYPIGGGLMTQLAAVNKIPILAFADKNISCKHLDALLPYGKYGNEPFTKDNLTSFHQYANRLINDVSFRRQEGTKLQQRLISPELFNRLLYDHYFRLRKIRLYMSLLKWIIRRLRISIWKSKMNICIIVYMNLYLPSNGK